MIALFEQLGARLGVDLGPLTRAMARLPWPGQSPDPIGTISQAHRIWGCDFYLDFPEPFEHFTPTNVELFGSTGVDCNQFGFVAPTGPVSNTDELMVALLQPKDDEIFVFQNLAAFLSLVATAGTEAIVRDMTDEDFAEAREHALQDEFFAYNSLLLCSLPGVSVPASPAAVLRESPKVEFKVTKAPPAIISLGAARKHAEANEHAQAAEVLVLLVDKFLDLGDLVPEANWEALGELLDRVQPELSDAAQAGLKARGVG
ncbi:MAG: hypothetical protein AB7K71_11615 [Polyangiaceae bacterium]